MCERARYLIQFDGPLGQRWLVFILDRQQTAEVILDSTDAIADGAVMTLPEAWCVKNIMDGKKPRSRDIILSIVPAPPNA